MLMLLFSVALFLIAQALVPDPEIDNAKAATLSEFDFPRATQGSPAPLVFGKVRVNAPNTLWYGHFNAKAIMKTVKISIFKKKDYIVGWRYFLTFDLGICLGETKVSLHEVLVEKDVIFSGLKQTNGERFGVGQDIIVVSSNSISGGFDSLFGYVYWYTGDFTQGVNTQIDNYIPDDDYIPHRGLAHMVFHNVYIGESPYLRKISFTVSRYPNALGLGAETLYLGDAVDPVDMNPIAVIYDLMVGSWGTPSINVSHIDVDSFNTAALTLADENFGISLQIDRPSSAKQIISEIVRHINGIMYQDPTTGKIGINLIRNDYVVEDLPVFDPSNVLEFRNFSSSAWKETINQVRVSFTNRDAEYNVSNAFAQDMANINFQGSVRSMDMEFPMVCVPALANDIAWRELAVVSVPLYKMSIEVNRDGATMLPGREFRFNWPNDGVENMVMRVARMRFSELAKDTIVLDAIQDEFAASTSLFASPTGTLWIPPDTQPLDALYVQAFPTPYFLLRGAIVAESPLWADPDTQLTGFLWILATPADTAQVMYSVFGNEDFDYTDPDKTEYELDGVVYPHSMPLLADMSKNYGKRDGVIPSYLIGGVSDTTFFPTTRTTAEVREGYNLCYINGEFMAFESAFDESDGTWTLTNLYRALLDTDFADHSAGEPLYFIDVNMPWLSTARYAYDASTRYLRVYSSALSGSQPDGQYVAIESGPFSKRYQAPLPPDLQETVHWFLDNDQNSRLKRTVQPSKWIVLYPMGVRQRDDFVADLYNDADVDMTGLTLHAKLYFGDVLINSTLGAFEIGNVGLLGLGGIGGSTEAKLELYTKDASGVYSYSADTWEFEYREFAFSTDSILADSGFEGADIWTQYASFDAIRDDVHDLLVPHSGTYFWRANTNTDTIGAYQDYDITAADQLKLVGCQLQFDVWVARSSAVLDVPYIVLEFWDISPAVIAPSVSSSTAHSPAAEDTWERRIVNGAVPNTTVKVRASVMGTPVTGGQTPLVAWDDARLIASMGAPVGISPTYDTQPGVAGVDAAWGLRLLVSGYAGPLFQVRDGYDSSLQQVFADNLGNPAPFYTRGTPTLTILYDQSVNAQDIVAVAANREPVLKFQESRCGRLAAYFDNTSVGNESAMYVTGATTQTAPYMTAHPNTVCIFDGEHTDGNSHVCGIPIIVGAYFGMVVGVEARKYFNYYINNYRGFQQGVTKDFSPNGGYTKLHPENVVWLDWDNGEIYHMSWSREFATTRAAFWPGAPTANYTYNTKFVLGYNGTSSYMEGNFYEAVVYNTAAGAGLTAVQRTNAMTAMWDWLFGVPTTVMLDMEQNPPDDMGRYNYGPSTLTGTASRSAVQAKFGTYSLLLDGSADGGLELANEATFDLDVEEFTIECWIWLTSVSAGDDGFCIASHWDATTDKRGWAFYWDNSDTDLVFEYSRDGEDNIKISGNKASWTPNQWYHVVVRRMGNSIDFYVDGVPITGGSTQDPIFYPDTPLVLGRIEEVGGPIRHLDGYMDEFRFVAGECVYVEDFSATLPVAAFPKP